ncbi:MAG: DUF1559 domain-containing protein [Gemmataceae bacterium]|nr:DUF1559 domain-containing protein [Gemmataceae bacterium]
MRHVDHRSRAGGAKINITLAILACGLLIALLLPTTQILRGLSAQTQSTNNLKILALGCHGFHDVNKRLPFNGSDHSVDSVAYYRKAKPLSQMATSGSWGYQILPYLDSHPIWLDLEGNNRSIPGFMCPGRNRSVLETESDYFINNYLNNPENAETPDNADRKRKWDDITDGLANTILLGHGNISTAEYGLTKGTIGSCSIQIGGTFGTTRSGPNWVKGQPLSVELRRDSADPPDFKAGGWGGPFPQGALMAMADATVRMFPYAASGEVFAVLLTPIGGERVEVPE